MKQKSNKRSVRILGIDPGYALLGYGVVDYDGYRFRPLSYGCVRTEAGTPFEQRLETIWDELGVLIQQFQPTEMAVEQLFFQTNRKTAIDVAQARGVVLLCAVKHGVHLSEYTPLQIKQAVVGYGKAEKNQVQQMTRSILRLKTIPKPDDAADALAIAICHGHSAGVQGAERRLLQKMGEKQ